MKEVDDLEAHDSNGLRALLSRLSTTITNCVLGLHTEFALYIIRAFGDVDKMFNQIWTKIFFGGILQSVHLKRKTEAKLLICQTHGVQLFASWEDVLMLVANLMNHQDESG